MERIVITNDLIKILEKKDISLKAKGLITCILANNGASMDELIKMSADGNHATRQAVKELLDIGLIKRIKWNYVPDFGGIE